MNDPRLVDHPLRRDWPSRVGGGSLGAYLISPRLALAALLVAALAGAVLWLRADAARQREAELTAASYQDRILRMRQAQEKRDAANRLDNDGLLDALGRWIVPDSRP